MTDERTTRTKKGSTFIENQGLGKTDGQTDKRMAGTKKTMRFHMYNWNCWKTSRRTNEQTKCKNNGFCEYEAVLRQNNE